MKSGTSGLVGKNARCGFSLDSRMNFLTNRLKMRIPTINLPADSSTERRNPLTDERRNKGKGRLRVRTFCDDVKSEGCAGWGGFPSQVANRRPRLSRLCA
jgi:hypothetical protein